MPASAASSSSRQTGPDPGRGTSGWSSSGPWFGTENGFCSDTVSSYFLCFFRCRVVVVSEAGSTARARAATGAGRGSRSGAGPLTGQEPPKTRSTSLPKPKSSSET